jgi:hypothetical protein
VHRDKQNIISLANKILKLLFRIIVSEFNQQLVTNLSSSGPMEKELEGKSPTSETSRHAAKDTYTGAGLLEEI